MTITLEMLADLSPMKTVYAMNEEEAEKIEAEMKEKGLELATVSDVGLKEGIRMTFLPESVFEKKD